MIYTPLTKKALALCFQAHRDQVDKEGLPYVFHPFHLALEMQTEAEVCTALLHDVVEDGGCPLSQLTQAGFPPSVVAAVALLTHGDGVSYDDYIRRVAQDPLARKVKLADLAHNSHPGRLAGLDEATRRRLLDKYARAKALLNGRP